MKKSQNKINTNAIRFWRNNRLDQEHTMSLDQLKESYLTFLKGKDLAWVAYYGDQTVVAFITDKEGLSSVTDQEVIHYLVDALHEIRTPFTREYDRIERERKAVRS